MEDVNPTTNILFEWERYYSALNIGVIVLNIDCRIEYVNPIFSRQLNVDEKKLIGKPITSYFNHFPTIRECKRGTQSNTWYPIWNDTAKYLVRIVQYPTALMPYYIFFSIEASELASFIPQLSIHQDFKEELMAILNGINESIYITDGEGNTILMNKAAEKTGGLTVEDVIGRNMRDLVAEGYCSESVSLKAIEEKKACSIIQKLSDGTELLVTGIPYFKNGKIQMVITTEKDITELNELKKDYEVQKHMAQKYQSELQYLRSQNAVFDDVVVESDEMQSIVNLALRVAKLDTTILIQGESGVGKEVFAKIIYHNSERNKGPFIKVNCGAIPENLIESELFGYEKGAFTGAVKDGKPGLFELAHTGTLFLDEIGELPLSMQVKLLRAIQEKEIRRIGGKESIKVDVRILAATNRDLKKAVKKKHFRADLFYRLNVVPITIPPLRVRKQDIKRLTYYFIGKFNQRYKLQKSIDPESIKILMNYDWPGNVRELENIIERVIVTSPENILKPHHFANQLSNLDSSHLVFNHEEIISLKDEMNKFEKNLLISSIFHCESTEELAKLFKVDRSTIIRKLRKHKIKNIYSDK